MVRKKNIIMKTTLINLGSLFLLTIVGCTAIEECPMQEFQTLPSLLTRSTVTFDSDIYYHEGTGLVLQAYDIFENPQVYKMEENVTGITHLGVKFFPKDYQQQRMLDNSEVANVRYIPFGFSPVVPDDQEWVKDPSSLPKFPEVSPYMIDTKDCISTENGSKPSEDIQLPIMYALWPVSEPMPDGIEYEVCFQVNLNQETGGPSTRSFDYGDYVFNAQFISYDELLDDDIPLRNLKIEMSYDIYFKRQYTNSNGCVSFVPSSIAGLPISHYTDLSMIVVMDSADWTITQGASGTTPIHHIIGVASSLWINPSSGDTFISERNSYSTEYEIHRAVDYYFNSTHGLSSGITSGEHGVVIHALGNNPGYDGKTTVGADGSTYVAISNSSLPQNETIGVALHELGHARMFKTVGFNSYSSANKYFLESYASFVGWFLCENYYDYLGLTLPYSWYPITGQDRQDWTPNITNDLKYYTPFFIDLVDSYSQPYIIDQISGIPVSAVESMMASYSTLSQCGSMIFNYAGSGFTISDINQYLNYYTGL